MSDLSRFAAQIPEEWYEYDVDGLRRLTEALYGRRLIIRDLITAFRRSNRNPFPNWADKQGPDVPDSRDSLAAWNA
jgi:hypothetical protein